MQNRLRPAATGATGGARALVGVDGSALGVGEARGFQDALDDGVLAAPVLVDVSGGGAYLQRLTSDTRLLDLWQIRTIPH
jgi:hypothetical protein